MNGLQRHTWNWTDNMVLRRITEQDDAELAAIIRQLLEKHQLDIPGTVYFDKELDRLSRYYLAEPDRDYFVAVDEKGKVAGGVGYARFDELDSCAELQKLYLKEEVQGNGYGYTMIEYIKKEASKCGYKQLYLETHTNLPAAIHMYEKTGFKEIERLPGCVHSTMNRFYLAEL